MWQRRQCGASGVAFDIAVVLQTIARPSVYRAIRSVFEQRLGGRIHLLIGVDRGEDDRDIRDYVRSAPDNVVCSIVNIGMSNATIYGGVYSNRFGGSLRAALSLLANAQYVAYLDDDDWWDDSHLALMLTALADAQWAFSLRRYVNPLTQAEIGEDRWESVGPGKGAYNEQFGGFVCPSCLALDKMHFAHLLHMWGYSPFDAGDGEDRLFFELLVNSGASWAGTNAVTTSYAINPADKNHPRRLEWFEEAGYDLSRVPTLEGPTREAKPR
jgi:hypothetical protein